MSDATHCPHGKALSEWCETCAENPRIVQLQQKLDRLGITEADLASGALTGVGVDGEPIYAPEYAEPDAGADDGVAR